MPAIASGIKKISSYKKQSGLGSAASGSGGKTLRRVSHIPKADRNMYSSNEIVAHHQSTGSAYGLQMADSQLQAELSAGTFADFFASMVERDFATSVNSGSLTITYGGSANAWTASRASGSFLTDGFKVGMVFRASSGSVTDNNARNFWATAVTALSITFRALDGATVTSGSSTTTTLTVHGKYTYAPTSGHTTDYYSIEDWYSGITKSELFEDMRVGAISVSLPASGNATATFDFVGLGRTKGNSQVLTSPTTTTTAIMSAINGVVMINGTAQTLATGLNISITNNAQNSGAVIGSNVGGDVTTGRITVTGSFTAQFDGTTLQDLKDNETNTSINVIMTGDETATADYFAINIPRIKITTDTPDDGEKAIVRTYNFIAEYNGSGGSGVSSEQTIISFQDSAA